jgi:hypothetical protein
MTKEEKLTQEVQILHKAILAFVEAAPTFENEKTLAQDMGRALANVETTLHWQFDCFELGLPKFLKE